MDDAIEETMESPEDQGAYRLPDSPSHLLHRAQQFAAEMFAERSKHHVTLRQLAVLAAVNEQAGRTQVDLVRATGIDRSTLAEMIARMESKGLLAREKSSEDGRAKSVRLTAKGLSRLEEAAPHARAVDLAILEALPKPKRKALLEILQALSPAIDAAHEEKPKVKPKLKAKLKDARKAEKKLSKKKASKEDAGAHEAGSAEAPRLKLKGKAKG